MYLGVLRDEARLREKALKLQSESQSQSGSGSGIFESLPISNASNTSNPPLNTPSAPVQQPSSVVDADCETCKVSPPPQLLESQSPEVRRREREARAKEYEDQKGLGERLVKEQGHSKRMV